MAAPWDADVAAIYRGSVHFDDIRLSLEVAALPHFPHANRGLPHVLVPALVHVPKFPHAHRIIGS